MERENTILLIAPESDQIVEVRRGKIGEAECQIAARIDLNEDTGRLADMAQGCRVVVLVPSRYVVFRETLFQGKKRHATPLALAYPHEAGLLNDSEQMHWVILGRSQRNYAIAGVALAQMRIWLDGLHGCGIRVDSMIPDVLALPLPGKCSALRREGEWLFRTGRWQGMQLPDSWEGSVPLPEPDWCLHQGGAAPSAWQNTTVSADVLWPLAGEAWCSKFTLLQGNFRPARRWLSRMPDKTVCAMLLLTVSLLTGGIYQQMTARQSDRQIAALTQYLLPGQPKTSQVEQAINQRIQRMQQVIQAPQFFKLLPYAANTLSVWSSPQLQALSFDASRDWLQVTVNKNDEPMPSLRDDNHVTLRFSEESESDRAILTVEGK